MITPLKKTRLLAALLGLGLAASYTEAATCTYKVDNEWSTGFVASITITNNGNSAVNGWNVGWTYNQNKVTNLWNAVFAGSNPYTAGNLDWNKTIQPGQSISFGFQGNKNNSAAAEVPVVTGAVCSGGPVSSSSAPKTSSSSSKSSVTTTSSSTPSSIPSSSSSKSSISSSKSSVSSSKSSASSANNGGFVSQHGRLKTVNGRLVDQYGVPTPLHGMSTHGLHWFGQYANKDSIKWLRDDWNINVIRAAMYTKEGGYLDNASVINKVWETIDAAIAADIYVIVDWHILTDGNPLTHKEAAKAFFQQVTAKYGNDPHIIYEIANEPNAGSGDQATVSWANAIKPYANEVIPVIRAGAPDSIVIVGTAVWSQRLDQVMASPLTFNNVAYAVHFYACSAEHQEPLRAIVKAAAEAKLAIFSTEWGNSEYTGNGSICPAQSDIWMDLLDQYGISWVNWSLADKAETSAALRSGASATGGWTSAQLTDSGNYVRNRLRSYANPIVSSSSSSVKSSATTSSSSSSKSSAPSSSSVKSSIVPYSSSSSSSSVKSSSVSSLSSSISSTVPGVRVDNPFVGAKWYVNQDWANNAIAYGGAAGAKIAKYNTAVWMDRIGAIDPVDPSVMGLRDHLDAALDQGANLIQVVVYDLPNRDCFALASNGELKIKENGFNRYKNEYITPLVSILADPKYKNIRIVAIIEPDSLPNLVTNLSDPDCQEAAGAGGYVEATQFTLNALYPLNNVYSYIDIAHSGWLGWDSNFTAATTFIANAIKGTTHGVNSIVGFISNTANATPLKEPFLDSFSMSPMPGSNGGTQVRQAKFYEWSPMFSEVGYVQAWRTKMISLGFPATIGMLVDTSRNGWGGAGRPAALSTSTNVDTFVNESRIDRRSHRGMWCNQASGIGERPTVEPEPGIDAYVWVKPPGESDGVAMAGIIDPTDPAKGFDRFCDPTFIAPGTNGLLTGALPNAPHAGRWFTEGFKVLLQNAYPPIQ